MRSAVFAFVASVLLAAGAAQAGGYVTFDPENDGATTFAMPSGNIECIFTPVGGTSVYQPSDGGPELSCDRMAPTYMRFILHAAGPAEMIRHVGDPGCCGAVDTFAYGLLWRIAPFTCTSDTTGLQCNRDDGHGFFISRANVQAY